MSASFRELRAKKTTSPWSWLAAAFKDPSLIAIVSFCAIGLLVTLNLMLRFPDLGALIAQYNQFRSQPLVEIAAEHSARQPSVDHRAAAPERQPAGDVLDPSKRPVPSRFSALSTFFRA